MRLHTHIFYLILTLTNPPRLFSELVADAHQGGYSFSAGMEPVYNALALTPATVIVAIERVVTACQPLAIFAFGSRVYGHARPDSDLDLFVLLPTTIADASALRRRLRALLADLPFSKDILVSDVETYSHTCTRLNSVYQDIATESIPLWFDHRLNQPAIEQVCR